ncbi:MAG: DNA polymerase III subunit delta', partial [Gammaproteobacteria bacterium]
MFNIDNRFDKLPWLEACEQQLYELLAADRLPHALMIQGLPGMGRRHLAMSLATRILGADPTATVGGGRDEEEAGHPDFYPVTLIPTDSNPNKLRTVIVVDQIRELIEELSLTSYGPGGKVAVIYPADKLNVNAANSLLKTLEEPPGKTTIILVCESPRRLPATIISRCQCLRLAAPPATLVLEWLESQAPGTRFDNLLDFAGGAPLQALQLHESGFAGQAND